MSVILIIGLIAIFKPTEEVEKNNLPVFVEQQQAFVVLANKCNVCHRTQNPNRVFTLDNMNGLAKKINRQVFVWKRMPKGNKIKLNTKEKLALKNWINKLK